MLAVRCSQPEPGLDRDADSVTGLSDKSLEFCVIYELGLIFGQWFLYRLNVKSKRVSSLQAIVNHWRTTRSQHHITPLRLSLCRHHRSVARHSRSLSQAPGRTLEVFRTLVRLFLASVALAVQAAQQKVAKM